LFGQAKKMAWDEKMTLNLFKDKHDEIVAQIEECKI
jgi:hypothetical protein